MRVSKRAAEPIRHRRNVRESHGDRSLSRSDDWNRTFGADARLGLGEYFTMAGFAARTETPGLTGRDYAYNVDSEYNDARAPRRLRVRAHGRGLQPRGRVPARTKTAIGASCSGSTRRCGSRRSGTGASVNGSRTSTTRATTTSMVARATPSSTSTTIGTGRTATAWTPR